jgi:hypothetical protein
MMDDLYSQFAGPKGYTDLGQDVTAFNAPDLSPKDIADHTAGIFARAWEGTGLVEVVEVQASAGQVHILGRVKRENERELVNNVVKAVYTACNHKKGQCVARVAKPFFLKDNGQMAYAWEFTFISSDLKAAAQVVCDAIEMAIPRREVLEAPLMGPKCPQGGPGSRKGASPCK